MATAEAARIVEVFALSFNQDPTWGWAFPNPEARLDHHRAWWSLFVHTAVPYGWVWMTEDGGAASLWIPPGKPELSAEDAWLARAPEATATTTARMATGRRKR